MEILSDPTPDMLAMPRFDDGAIDMQELLRRLAEQVVNAVMDAEADQLCGGGANSRNGYREVARHLRRHADAAHPEAPHRQLLPGRRDRALPARGPRPRGRRRRDVRHRHEHPQGAEGGEKMGVSRLSKDQVSAIASSLTPTSRSSAQGRSTARRCPRLARRDLCPVPPRGARRLHRRGHRHRLRDAGGWRRVLGVDVVDTESYDSWLAFPADHPLARGAAGVRLVVPDAHPGLVRALGEVSRAPRGSAAQSTSCATACARPALAAQAPRGQDRLAGVPAGATPPPVTAMYHAACDMLEGCCPRAAAVLEEAEPDALAYLDFPPTPTGSACAHQQRAGRGPTGR